MPAIFPAALAAAGGGSMMQGLLGAAPLVSAGGSLLGGLGSLFGSRGMSQADAMALQYSTAMDMYREQLLHGPAWEMAGLRAAGINPMLRYGHGGAQPPMMGFSPSIAQPFNRWEGLARALEALGPSAFRAGADDASAERARAEIPRIGAEVRKIGEDIRQVQANTALSQQQRANALAEHGNILRQELIQMSVIALQDAQARNNEAQAAQAAAHIEYLEAQTSTEAQRELATRWEASLRQYQAFSASAAYSVQEIDRDYWTSTAGRFMRGLMLGREAIGVGFGASGASGSGYVHGSVGR